MAVGIENIWTYIGSAWSSFQDKDTIEKFWQASISGHQYVLDHLGNVQFSRIVDLMDPTFDYGPEVYKIVYSGATTDLNVDTITATIEQVDNGGFEISASGWVTGLYDGTFSRSAVRAHTGSYSLLTQSQGGSAVYDLGAKKGAASQATAWVYISSIGIAGAASKGDIGLELLDGDDNVVASVSADENQLNTWQKLTIYSTSQKVRKISLRNLSWKADAFWDDISLIKTGYFEYAIPEYTYSIPTLRYKYVQEHVTYSGTFTEGVDYLISTELNSILWLAVPVPDLRFSDKGVMFLIADHVYQINPVLGDVWAKQVGLDLKLARHLYRTYGQDKYLHLKMLVWALQLYQQRAPSIHTLKHAYGIARGLPFTYASGLLSYSLISGLYNVTVDDYTYTLPSGVHPVPSGYYDQFELIASGFNLYDYTTDPALLNAYTNPYNRRSTLIYRIDTTLSGISFSRDFLSTYVDKIMPLQIQYLLI